MNIDTFAYDYGHASRLNSRLAIPVAIHLHDNLLDRIHDELRAHLRERLLDGVQEPIGQELEIQMIPTDDEQESLP